MIEKYSDESDTQPKNISDSDIVTDYYMIKELYSWLIREGASATSEQNAEKRRRLNQLFMKHSISPANDDKITIFKRKAEAASYRLGLRG
jgi:hypothetical protein